MPRYITIPDLSTKHTPGLKQVFSLSFEYLLVCISGEYSSIQEAKGEKYGNVSDFNQRNRLTPGVILSYPFFVALANGHSEALYKLFGPFLTLKFGPASTSIFTLMKENEKGIANPPLKYFNITSQSSSGIEIMRSDEYGDLPLTSVLPSIKGKIMDEYIEFADETVLFRDITVVQDISTNKDDPDYSQVSQLSKAIDNGVYAIVEQSEGTFLNGNVRSILAQSQYFKALVKAMKSNANSIVEYEQIESPRSRPFYSNILN
jgi:hypothetical protein